MQPTVIKGVSLGADNQALPGVAGFFAAIADGWQGLQEMFVLWQRAEWHGQSILFAVSCLGVVLLFLAQSAPSANALARRFWLAAVGICIVGAWLAGGMLLKPIPGGQGVALAIAMLALGVWAIGKTVQAHRFAALRDARAAACRPAVPLAAHREEFVRALAKAVVGERAHGVIGLQGGWGAGKSRLVERLVAGFDSGEYGCDVVAVSVNIWEYQNYGDLQWGVLQAVYAHPRSLQNHGWLDLPLWMLVANWMRLRVRDFKLAFGGNEVNGQAELRLPWQYHLEKAVARQRRRSRNVLLVLDEIDRGDAVAVQSVLTLLRRSLNLPGVVAVVPYVPEVVREKAFNPLALALPDLIATAHVLLMEIRGDVADAAPGQTRRKGKSKRAVAPPDFDPFGDAASLRDQEAAIGLRDGQTAGKPAPGDLLHGAVLRLAPLLRRRRERDLFYYARMEEKYLGERWHLPSISVADLLWMLDREAVLQEAFGVAYGNDAPLRVEQLKGWLRALVSPSEFLDRLGKARFRRLKGYWMEHLTRNPHAPAPLRLAPEIPLALAVWRASRAED